jgi:hypothetical protein
MHDRGHEFQTRTDSWDTYMPYVAALGSPNGNPGTPWWYRGPVTAAIGSLPGQGLPEWSISSSEIDEDGARAITASAPTAPQAGFGQFLGELREGLPSLVGAKTVINAKKRGGPTGGDLGNEWVNHNFATMPLASDIVKTARAMLNVNSALQQLLLDNGKAVRRRRTLYEKKDYIQKPNQTLQLVIPPMIAKGSVTGSFLSPSGVTCTVSDEINVECKFASAFSYFLGNVEDFLDASTVYEQRARSLLGASITPSVIWELTPWSWLIDWNYNFGGFLKAAEMFSSDNLVMRYGYIMHTVRATRYYTATMPIYSERTHEYLGIPTFVASTTWKNRRRATPYGFGLNVANFSPKRWSILGALGMTKGHQALHVD